MRTLARLVIITVIGMLPLMLLADPPAAESQVVAKPATQPAKALPSIAGKWQEASDIVVDVSQTGAIWTARCSYTVLDTGEVRWEMKGTIDPQGKIKGVLRHTVAPKGWALLQTREGQLSTDGDAITGSAKWKDGKADFRWVRDAVGNQDRFASERRAKQAEIISQITRNRKQLDSQQRMSLQPLGNENSILTEQGGLEFELAEIRKHPQDWAPTLKLEVGSVGRFYPAAGKDNIQVVQIVDGQNMIAKFGNSQIWVSGVDTSTWADKNWVYLPGLYRVVSNKTYETAAGSMATVFLVKPDR